MDILHLLRPNASYGQAPSAIESGAFLRRRFLGLAGFVVGAFFGVHSLGKLTPWIWASHRGPNSDGLLARLQSGCPLWGWLKGDTTRNTEAILGGSPKSNSPAKRAARLFKSWNPPNQRGSAQTPVERPLSYWKGGLCTSMLRVRRVPFLGLVFYWEHHKPMPF